MSNINYRTSQESLFSSRLFLALIVSSLAALPPTLILLTLEGSVIRYFGWIGSGANFSYLIAGFLLPILLLALIPVSHGDWHDLADTNNIDFMLVFAIAGAAVALTFRALIFEMITICPSNDCNQSLDGVMPDYLSPDAYCKVALLITIPPPQCPPPGTL